MTSGSHYLFEVQAPRSSNLRLPVFPELLKIWEISMLGTIIQAWAIAWCLGLIIFTLVSVWQKSVYAHDEIIREVINGCLDAHLT